MLTWIEIHAEDVANYLANDQLQLLRTQHLGESKDPLLAIIGDVCNFLKSFVPRVWQKSTTPNAVPTGCKLLAIFLIIEALQSRVPEFQLSTDQVRNAQNARHALERLTQVWEKEIKEEKNPDPKTDQTSTEQRIEALRFRKNTVNNKTLNGL